MILNQTTLGELYQSLSIEEVKGLDLYLQKNTVGKNNMLYQLHKLMVDVKHQAMLAKLDTDYLKAELFGGDTKSVSKLTTYNNLLINHIKDYLILSKVKEKNIYTETLWGEILIERRLKRNLLLKITNFRLNLYKDSYALLKNFFHSREQFFYQYLVFTKKNLSTLIQRQIYQIHSFEEHYNYYKLELLDSLNSFVNIRKHKTIISLDETREIISKNLNSTNKLITIKALVFKMSVDKSIDCYYELKQILFEESDNFSLEHFIQLITSLTNFCLYQITISNEDFDFENYKILKFIYEKKFLFKEGIYSVLRLITIIRLELRYGTVEKAEQLLEESLKVISPAQKDSFQYLIESRIAFAKKDFKLSLRRISVINPSDSIYYFPQYKIMLIKNYIMLADIDRLMAERENFYKYLNNQKNIQEDEKRRHKLFIKYTEYLTNARYEHLTDYMKRRIENALLQTSPYFSEKQWVRERWEELKSEK